MKELKKVMKVMKNDFGWSGKLLKEQEDFVKDLINATKKALTLNGVSQQRELLTTFRVWWWGNREKANDITNNDLDRYFRG